MAEFVEYDLSEDGWNDGYAEDGYDFSQDLYRNGTVAAENVPKKLFNFIAGAYFIICAHETPDVYLQRGPGNLTLPEISRRSGKVAATLQMPNHQVARSHCQLPRPILIKAAKLSLQDLVSVGEIEKLCPTRACLALLIKISCDWPYKNELNAIPKHGSAVLELIFVCTSRCAEPMNQTKANVYKVLKMVADWTEKKRWLLWFALVQETWDADVLEKRWLVYIAKHPPWDWAEDDAFVGAQSPPRPVQQPVPVPRAPQGVLGPAQIMRQPTHQTVMGPPRAPPSAYHRAASVQSDFGNHGFVHPLMAGAPVSRQASMQSQYLQPQVHVRQPMPVYQNPQPPQREQVQYAPVGLGNRYAGKGGKPAGFPAKGKGATPYETPLMTPRVTPSVPPATSHNHFMPKGKPVYSPPQACAASPPMGSTMYSSPPEFDQFGRRVHRRTHSDSFGTESIAASDFGVDYDEQSQMNFNQIPPRVPAHSIHVQSTMSRAQFAAGVPPANTAPVTPMNTSMNLPSGQMLNENNQVIIVGSDPAFPTLSMEKGASKKFATPKRGIRRRASDSNPNAAAGAAGNKGMAGKGAAKGPTGPTSSKAPVQPPANAGWGEEDMFGQSGFGGQPVFNEHEMSPLLGGFNTGAAPQNGNNMMQGGAANLTAAAAGATPTFGEGAEANEAPLETEVIDGQVHQVDNLMKNQTTPSQPTGMQYANTDEPFIVPDDADDEFGPDVLNHPEVQQVLNQQGARIPLVEDQEDDLLADVNMDEL